MKSKASKASKASRTKNNRAKRRKTYRAGGFTHQRMGCSPIIHYVNLSKHIKSPYKWTMQQYRQGGCDMYIWKGDNQTSHIHIHGFHPMERSQMAYYEFTITEYGEKNLKAYLPNMNEDGYKDVLQQMYDVLNKVVVRGRLVEGKKKKPLINWKTPDRNSGNNKSRPTKTTVHDTHIGSSRTIGPTKLFDEEEEEEEEYASETTQSRASQ